MISPGKTVSSVNDLLAILVQDGVVDFDGQKYLAESIFEMTFSFIMAAIVSEKFQRCKNASGK